LSLFLTIVSGLFTKTSIRLYPLIP
jgi:hypothetical protein